MSEKLRSIPKETIQVAPKEVVLPPALLSETEIPNINGLPDCDQEIVMNENEQPKTEVINEHSKNNIYDVQKVNENDLKDDLKSCEIEQQDKHLEDDPTFVQDKVGYVQDDERLSNDHQIQDHVNFHQDSPEFFQDQQLVEDQPGLIEEFPECVQDPLESVQDHPESAQDDPESVQNGPESVQDHPDSVHDDVEDIPKEFSNDDLSFNKDEIEEEDDFGNFEEATENTIESVPVPPLNLDDDDVEDDDFGDFEEGTVNQDGFASSKGWASLESSPRSADVQAVDQILIGLQLKLASVISNLFCVNLESPLEVGLDQGQVHPLDFTKEDCEDAVWIQVHSVSTTPALNQKWKDTMTRNKLLTYLKIDPNNVVSQLLSFWTQKIFL